MEKLMSTSFNSNSLSRCQTPSSLNGTLNASSLTSSRPAPSPKCFGKNTHVLKEDYERDRRWWQAKLEEVESRLSETSIQNSELFQTKAQLKRKIIDLEKNQRPLLEQNRRQNDRIRTLNGEIKKLEDKLAFVQDDFLTTRDNLDRCLRENAQLKEQRAFPEKLEELNRYRNQVLESSKCIIALRQSAIEKDRRYELLLHKFRKVKKSLPKRSAAEDDDHQSCIGSEGSIDSGSLLDTIAEDLDEDVDLTSDFLRPGLGNMEYSLKQQLDLANMTITELQNALENANKDRITTLTTTVNRIQSDVDYLQQRERTLEHQLANEQEHNDLLEFQVLELSTQLSATRNRDISDKQCSTTISIPTENNSEPFDLGKPKKRHEILPEFVADSTKGLFDAMGSPLLRRSERIAIKHAIEIIDCLQNHLTVSETELNMANCEVGRLKRQVEEEEQDRKQIVQEELGKKQNKKDLQAEIDLIKKEHKEQSKSLNKQIREVNSELDKKNRELAQKDASLRDMNAKIETLKMELDILRARVSVEESTRNDLNSKLSQFEGQKQVELNTLRTELTRLRLQYEQKIKSLEADSTKINEQQKEMERLRKTIHNLEAEQQNGLSVVQVAGFGGSPRRLQQTSSFHSHIERRYEEQRQRVSDYQRQIARLEEQAEKDRKQIAQLRDGNATLRQVEQLQTYNRELEAQFNSQMDIITALKKKLILVNAGANGENVRTSTPGVWKLRKSTKTSSVNVSPSVSSDEQYHSEGSDGTTTGTHNKLTIDV